MMTTTTPTAIEIVRLLRCCRFDLSSEKHLQEGVEQAFKDKGLVFEREKRLSQQDIPDFFVAGGVVVECKMRNKAMTL